MYAGNPDTVYRQIMNFYDKVGGFGHLIMVGKTGFITHGEAVKNITLFSKEVLPACARSSRCSSTRGLGQPGRCAATSSTVEGMRKGPPPA